MTEASDFKLSGSSAVDNVGELDGVRLSQWIEGKLLPNNSTEDRDGARVLSELVETARNPESPDARRARAALENMDKTPNRFQIGRYIHMYKENFPNNARWRAEINKIRQEGLSANSMVTDVPGESNDPDVEATIPWSAVEGYNGLLKSIDSTVRKIETGEYDSSNGVFDTRDFYFWQFAERWTEKEPNIVKSVRDVLNCFEAIAPERQRGDLLWSWKETQDSIRRPAQPSITFESLLSSQEPGVTN